MRNIVFTACVLVIISTVISCDNKKVAGEDNDVVYDTIKVVDISHLDNDSTKPSCSLKVSFIAPIKYKDEAVLKKIQGELNYAFFEGDNYSELSAKDAVEKYVADYLENYNKEMKIYLEKDNYNDPDIYFSYYKVLEGNLLYNKSNIISYQISSTDFKGENTSSQTYRNVIFDLNNGDLLTESGIFLPNYNDKLDALIVQKLLEKNNVTRTEDLLELGFYKIEEISSNDNFSVDDKGITYVYNPNECSVPSLGAVKVFLPYSDLATILRPNTLLTPLSGI